LNLTPFTLDDALGYAIEAAKQSPCLSKRGVAIWDDDGLISVGFNHQPAPFVCDGSERCKSNCGKTAVHAEQSAILHANPVRLRGATLLHIKVAECKPVTSMGPSCPQCSKLILECGIKRVWLFHEKGWTVYTAPRFHWYSVGNVQLIVGREQFPEFMVDLHTSTEMRTEGNGVMTTPPEAYPAIRRCAEIARQEAIKQQRREDISSATPIAIACRGGARSADFIASAIQAAFPEAFAPEEQRDMTPIVPSKAERDFLKNQASRGTGSSIFQRV